jgi:hypothetical protein
MKRTVAALWLMVVLDIAQAHHSRAAFDLNKNVILQTEITAVRWTNPHAFYVGTVVNSKGQREEWTFEGHSISGLTRQGWSKATLNIGDKVQMVVNPHRDAQKHFGLIDHVRLADGRIMYSIGRPLSAAAGTQVQPSSDFSGNWQFRIPGTPEEVRQRVLLGSGGPAADLPYTPKARAQVAAYDPKKNPALTCEPISLPALLTTVYEFKWIRSSDRIVIRKEQYDDADRVIHLKNTARPANYKPNPLGYSVGRFEQDGTLVVETTGFSPVRWGNGPSVDSSDKKRIVERYKLIDGGSGMSLSYTFEDSEYFTKPVTRQGAYFKTKNREFAQQPRCDVEAAQQHLKFDE